jgi:hypothetical protein
MKIPKKRKNNLSNPSVGVVGRHSFLPVVVVGNNYVGLLNLRKRRNTNNKNRLQSVQR